MRFLKISVIAFIVLTVSVLNSFSQTKSAAKTALENEIKAYQKDAVLKNTAWAICVKNITDNTIEAEYNSNISLMPASTQKLVTTAAALDMLGNDYRFETKLQYTGEINSATGVLNGNLYIIGGGDPTLGSKRFGSQTDLNTFFNNFYTALNEKGIKSINGYLIADENIFGYLIPQSWSWEDVGNYFGSGATGISVNENMYRLYFNSGSKIGDSAKLVSMDPVIEDMVFVNNVKTAAAGTGDNVYIFGSPYTYFRVLDGTMPLGKKNFDVDGSLPDPAMYCISLFYNFLNTKGITINNGYTTSRAECWKGAQSIKDTAIRKDITIYKSPKLSDIVYYTNIYSVNLFAEAMLKILGYTKYGHGSIDNGIKAITTYWTSKSIDLKGFEIYDGSGLSRKDKITAKQLCEMLAAFSKSNEYENLYKSLPVAGVSGGIKGMLKNTVAYNNLRAKTGTMSDVKSYAGYVKNVSGDELSFAIIINNFTGSVSQIRAKCERLMQLIAELD